MLRRMNCPAQLELILPGKSGRRLITLVGMDKDHVLVEPAIAGSRSISINDLRLFWSGKGLILWKNYLHLPARLAQGSNRKHIEALQGLLREVHIYNQVPKGIYDFTTFAAVKAFQAQNGVVQDGIAGVQTLVLLYRSIDRFGVPKFAEGLGKEPHPRYLAETRRAEGNPPQKGDGSAPGGSHQGAEICVDSGTDSNKTETADTSAGDCAIRWSSAGKKREIIRALIQFVHQRQRFSSLCPLPI